MIIRPDAIVRFFFSPAGRFRRSDYWLAVLCLTLVNYLAKPYLLAAAAALKQVDFSQGLPAEVVVAWILLCLYCGIMLWVSAVAVIKRLHDFGEPGLGLLWFCVPIINIYYLLKVSAFRGQQAPNSYGLPLR